MKLQLMEAAPSGGGFSCEMPLGCRPPTYSVVRYTLGRKSEWDSFVKTAKNSTFLFLRDYMDYHRNRFADHSMMIYRDQELAALLPANLNARGDLVSHEGLTYGGLLVPRDATLLRWPTSLHALLRHLHELGIGRLFYKQIPSFYNALPDGEIGYLLFLLNAHLYRRDCALVVPLLNRLPFQKRRKRQFNRANRANVTLKEETTFAPFWEHVLVPRLASRYRVAPVHNVDEITLLASRFPGHVRQFSAFCDGKIVSGTTIYETPLVAHAQYIASTEHGRKIGALDYLFRWLMEEQYKNKRFFDFGICNENSGRSLNRGLLDWKEGFGGRCHTHDFYEILTRNFANLDPILS